MFSPSFENLESREVFAVNPLAGAVLLSAPLATQPPASYAPVDAGDPKACHSCSINLWVCRECPNDFYDPTPDDVEGESGGSSTANGRDDVFSNWGRR